MPEQRYLVSAPSDLGDEALSALSQTPGIEDRGKMGPLSAGFGGHMDQVIPAYHVFAVQAQDADDALRLVEAASGRTEGFEIIGGTDGA